LKNKISKTSYLNNIWHVEAQKFETIEKKVKIPDETLKDVNFVELKNEKSFDKIPSDGGCYWIWTNEPVCHQLHKHKIPKPIDKGEVIYNGIAKDNVNFRIRHHLMAKKDEGWSGISLDIFPDDLVRSHKKKVFSTKKRAKVPYVEIDGELKPIKDKKLVFYLFLSKDEKKYINSNQGAETFYFRNGINIFEPKHKKYNFRAYFITGVKWLYLEYAEKKWRKEYGLPKLCSYMTGR